jgi:DNA polymerase
MVLVLWKFVNGEHAIDVFPKIPRPMALTGYLGTVLYVPMHDTPPENLFDQLVTVLAGRADLEPPPVIPEEVFAPLAQPMPKGKRPTSTARSGKPSIAPTPVPQRSSTAMAPSSGTPNLSTCDLPAMEQLAAACTRCPLHAGRTRSVFADGTPQATLMFIGEAPGRDEDIQGKPFVGRAGQLLTKMIEAMQFRRDEVYIANIVKCRPPDNRVPTDEEAAACLPFLLRQIELVQPQVMVLLGATAVGRLLGKTGISSLRGHWHEFHGVRVMPTFHPAYLLRSPAKKKDAWEDLKKVMHVLGKDPRKTA